MMAALSAVMILVLGIAIPREAQGSMTELPEGEPNFELGVKPYPPETDGNIFTLAVYAVDHRRCKEPSTAEAVVTLPPGLELVSGDLGRVMTMPRNKRYWWAIRVRCTNPGEYVIPYVLRMEDLQAGERDVAEFETVLRVSGTRVEGSQRRLRVQHFANGKRYRYGGRHLVEIEEEDPIRLKIEREPIALKTEEGTCPQCSGNGSRVVRLVVTVSPEGSATWVRSGCDMKQTDPLVLAAEAAVRRWKFRHATAGGRPIAQWAIADVTVRQGPE